MRMIQRVVNHRRKARMRARDVHGIERFVTDSRGGLERYCRERFQAVALSPRVSICRVLGKYKMYVDNLDFGLSPHLLLDGYWEIWITQAMARMLRPGMVAVDIGANLGYYTHLMADAVGTDGHVTAFEPNPEIRDLMSRSLALNGYSGTVTLSADACSDKTGEQLIFFIPEHEPKNARIVTPQELAEIREPGTNARVSTVRLDDYFAPGSRVDFIKIDAEGAEEKIWNGMQRVMADNPGIIITLEYNGARYRDPERFLQEIQAPGFRLRHIEGDGGIHPITIQEIHSRFPTEDVIFYLHKD